MRLFAPEAVYVDSAGGRILLTAWRPAGTHVASVLFVPPFAEEMNKSRRMFALLGQELAERGVASVLPDLHCTGDSTGEFAEAEWDVWLKDLHAATLWSANHVAPVVALVALRLGAELAADATDAGLLPGLQQVVLWQPVFDRDRYLTQFLRLRTAALLAQEDRRESVDELKRALRDGESIEVAGYELGSTLARSLTGTAPRRALPRAWNSVHWMEVVRDINAPMSAPSQGIIEASRSLGLRVEPWVTAGEPFWTSTEIATCPSMIDRSSGVLTT